MFCAITSGCGNNVAGSYQREGGKSTLTLTKSGTFLLSTGDSGAYTVEGKSIIMSVPMFGGAIGTVSGSTLIFPESKSLVGESFQGIWKKNTAPQQSSATYANPSKSNSR
jgi:hypothetical protein